MTWRNPTSEHRAYFTALRDWGYPLSTVELLVLDDADDVSGRTAPDIDQAAPSVEEPSELAGDTEVPDPDQRTTARVTRPGRHSQPRSRRTPKRPPDRHAPVGPPDRAAPPGHRFSGKELPMSPDCFTTYHWSRSYLLPDHVLSNIPRRGNVGMLGAHNVARGLLVEICRHLPHSIPVALTYRECEVIGYRCVVASGHGRASVPVPGRRRPKVSRPRRGERR
jgi:hypothetical protein